MIRCPVWFGDDDLLEQEDQRQAPVAAEKQRSATHRCVFPDAGVRSDRMQQLLSGQFPATIILMTAIRSMKWPFNVGVATRRRFYVSYRKGNGKIFGSLNCTAETNLRSPILIEMRVAQILRSFDEVSSTKNLCACPSSQNLDTLLPFPRRTIFFSLPVYWQAGIQPRSDTTVSR